MRRPAILLLTVALLLPAGAVSVAAEPIGKLAALSPGVGFGQPARLATADEQARLQGTEDSGWGIDPALQHAFVGTAVLGGAFTLGLLASGSLSTAIGAAGAVAISYAVLP
ncbi:hypothetical protein ACO2RV_10840 [Ancylobacter sp. VNQ12]|uniref:hypothetical protein n=1 Tax=Ancylobacter sp. VNQ12 TaxID=3400920 RepID=UPI003C06600B